MLAHPGSKVGSHATLVKADTAGELMRASSVRPPDLESGPTGDTRHRMSSLQNGMAAMMAESGDSWHPLADTPLPTTAGSLHALTRGDRRPLTLKSMRSSMWLWDADGQLWCDVVRSSGNTGWHATLLVRNRCPHARETWATFSTVAKRDWSANVTYKRVTCINRFISHWILTYIQYSLNWLTSFPQLHQSDSGTLNRSTNGAGLFTGSNARQSTESKCWMQFKVLMSNSENLPVDISYCQDCWWKGDYSSDDSLQCQYTN